MNSEFAKRIEEYLASECSDYDLAYKWVWNESAACCEVEVKRDDHTQYTKYVNFIYDKVEDALKIELSEGCFYTTREFDQTVKYFWMLIAPALFDEKTQL